MFICEYCGKELKSQAGLKRHMNTCSEAKENQTEEVSQDEVQKTTMCDKTQRRIDKLRDAWRSTPDAESRYKIEQEIKALSCE